MNVHEYLVRATPFGFSGACLVGVGDEIALTAGYGHADRERGIENTPETVLSLGSVTKQFTAAAILKLEEDGKLNTTDAVEQYVDAPSDKAGITLHQLLTHTSGLALYSGDDYEPAGRDETVARMLAEPLRFPPGSDFAYSNAGYSLLAAVVELASGAAYEQFLREQLLAPAGLEATGYRLPGWEDRVVACWYAGGVDNGTPLEKPYPSWNLMGNGDMLSTTEDLWRWHRALREDTVLSTESRRKLFTPHAGDYGYGWRVLEGPHGRLVEHDGASSYGSSCLFKRFVDQDLVVVLFCNATVGGSPLAHVVADTVVAAAFGEAVRLPPPAEPDQLPASVVGPYRLASGGELRVDGFELEAVGQEAIDELAFGGSSHAAFNERALGMVSSVHAGDERALRAEVADDSERVQRYRELIRRLGGDVTAARTIPSHLDGVPATHVGSGDGAIAFYWREGTLLGLGEGDPAAGYRVRLARAYGGYVAYDLRLGQTVGVEFEGDGLALTSNGRTVRAERL